jgi:hypothetical protein
MLNSASARTNGLRIDHAGIAAATFAQIQPGVSTEISPMQLRSCGECNLDDVRQTPP